MAPPPSVEHSASSPILQGDQGDRAPAPVIPTFSIRGFTRLIRERDIRKTYPFISAVENAERKGKQVRLLLPSISPRVRREELSDSEEEDGEKQKAEAQVVRQEPEQVVERRGNGRGEDQQEGLALLGIVAEGEGSGHAEDKASDTGVTTEAETDEQAGAAGASAAAKEGEERELQQQQQQQNVCPVCESFTSHSVTALNAHMDSCLASPSTAKSHKSRSKHVKMRSITDIMSPRQSDSGSQKSGLRDKPEKEKSDKERRAPVHFHSDHNNNNSNNHAEQDGKDLKDVSFSGQQPQHQQHRQLRSRSRGSTSVPVPPKLDLPSAAVSDRWGSRRRSGGLRSGGDCSEPLRKRLHSGNSADPTNSWTHSISSGATTDCHSKTQDVVEKSCASTNSQTIPVLEVDADQSSKEIVNGGGGERSALVQVSENGTTTTTTAADVPAPAENPTLVPADGTQVSPENEPRTELEGKEAPAPEAGGGDFTQLEKAAAECVPATTAAPDAGIAAEPIPVVDVSRLVASPSPPPVLTALQTAPVYESIISSLRSPAVGSLAGTVPATSTPWKAAVVMASLGAVEVKSGRPDVPPAAAARPLGSIYTTAAACSSAAAPVVSSGSVQPPVQPVNNVPSKVPTSFRGPGAETYQVPSQQPVLPSSKGYTSSVPAADRARLPQQQQQQQQRAPQVARMPNSNDRMVIDVDQEGLRAQSGGRVERPVIRLLGQNVTVDSSTSVQRDGQGNRNPYGFSIPSLHSGAGYHTPCCCRSRHAHEPLAWKNVSCSNLANGSHIPVQGSWRLLPNGTLTQFGSSQVNLQAGGARMNSLGSGQRRPPLPPWLLEAKKQQDAANVIVIDDDDEEESKVTTEARTPPRAPGSSSGMPPPPRPSGASQKREVDGNMNMQQRADKVPRVADSDSPGSRMVLVPSLVPAWTIANCNNEGASTSSGSGSRRGATAQEFKARIAMMNINGQQPACNDQLPSSATGASTSTSQPRGGVVGSTVPPGYVYQFPAQHAARVFQLQGDGTAAPAPAIITHPSFVTPSPLQQQPLVFGRDCQIIQLEGQYLIVNTGVSEQQVLAPQGDHLLGRGLIVCNSSGNGGATASASNASNNLNSNNNNNNSNGVDIRRGAVASSEPILVTPVLQHQGNGYVFATPDQQVHHHSVIPLSVQQLQQLQLQQQQQISMHQRDNKGSRNNYGAGKNGH